MKELSRDNGFFCIVALQVAAISWLCTAEWGESLSLMTVQNWAQGAKFRLGSTLPFIPTYDETGYYQSLRSLRPRTLVLGGTCTCDDIVVENWLESARSKGENPVLVVPMSKLKEVRPLGWKGPIFHTRIGEFYNVGLLNEHGKGNFQIPLVVHLDEQGKIKDLKSR
ncbi:MAG: hypothetical protein EOP04_11640 [Proteobacteria bacterium]|nr:MAG: hypothetical protein EOP04_11640 [Pseudomonadota bacterium]